jgi:HEAT repeat protein
MPAEDNDRGLAILIRQLDSDDLHKRVKAIETLGEIGDELCLQELRTRMRYIHEEYQALIIAVGTLKKRLHVK